MTTVSTWTDASDPGRWPTRAYRDVARGFSVGVPHDWSEHQLMETELERTTLWRGPTPCDWLDVSAINANEMRSIEDWLQTVLGSLALPTAHRKQWMDTASVLDWHEHEADETESLQTRLDCAHVHAYRGLVAVIKNGGKPLLARVYSLVLGRQGRAWKVSLGLATECPPGIPEPMIANSDHVRAAAVFADLSLC